MYYKAYSHTHLLNNFDTIGNSLLVNVSCSSPTSATAASTSTRLTSCGIVCTFLLIPNCACAYSIDVNSNNTNNRHHLYIIVLGCGGRYGSNDCKPPQGVKTNNISRFYEISSEVIKSSYQRRRRSCNS